jgi:chromosome segregation protein
VERLDTEGGDQDLERGELRQLAAREAELRRALAEAADRRTAVQVGIARCEDRRGELTSALDEVSERLDQAGFAAPVDDAEAEELRARLERLERRRERIGPVNPLAEAECAELGERAAFLREQRRDLEKSITDLEALIRELSERVDAEFADTFAAVEEQFAHMVAVLFPGGRGRLVLVPPDEEHPLGGVAVEVKPAKKLGKKLQLLSGGERALVAIAFLMALVLARPCPFYILDEIEAALDDVNIGRLVQLLRDYRERTQFVIITHQKRTMEAADVLYGVTMGADGASQVVSARMAEEEIEREERARQRK